MRSPDDVEAAQLRETQQEAMRLATMIVVAVEAEGPLRRGAQYLVQIPGAWSQGAMVRAEDMLGEAGWRAVRLLSRADHTGAVCLMTCPDEAEDAK
jgi:hypothetical protein